MSSLYVRELVRSWMQDSAMTVPFFDTINSERDPGMIMWCTAVFDSIYWEKLTFCDDEMEQGQIILIYSGNPGVGDVELLTAIENDVALLMQKRDPNRRFVIDERSAPDDYTDGDADMQYRVAIFLSYTFYQ